MSLRPIGVLVGDFYFLAFVFGVTQVVILAEI
jgi:hypothetical protein